MLHSHIKKLSQAPSLRSPLVGPLRFNEFLVPSLLHSQPSNFALRITVIFHPINIRQHRIQPKINDPRLCFASSFFLISSETITDRPIVDTSRFRLDSSRTSFVEIVKVSRDTMNYSCRGDAKLRETFLRRGVPVCACFTLRAFRPSESVCVCMCAYSCARVVKGYEGPGRGMNAGKHGIIERWKGRMKVCKKEKKG